MTVILKVGTFNISKTSSAPDLMMNFNGKDVYSLAYSIDTDTKKCTLYANNANKLMMFNESATKTDNHESISFPVAVSSVSVNDKFIAIGLSNGTLKILLNNKEKTVRKTFLGLIKLHSHEKMYLNLVTNQSNYAGNLFRHTIEKVLIGNVMVISESG